MKPQGFSSETLHHLCVSSVWIARHCSGLEDASLHTALAYGGGSSTTDCTPRCESRAGVSGILPATGSSALDTNRRRPEDSARSCACSKGDGDPILYYAQSTTSPQTPHGDSLS